MAARIGGLFCGRGVRLLPAGLAVRWLAALLLPAGVAWRRLVPLLVRLARRRLAEEA